MVVSDLVKQNIEILFKISKAGIKDINVALDYQAIYVTYNSFSNIKSKMERIEATAKSCKVYSTTVRTAIKFMQMAI